MNNQQLVNGNNQLPENIQKIRKEFPLLDQRKELIYFDNGATTQKPKRVIDALTSFYSTQNANIHRGIYSLSEDATHAFERVRSRCANYLRCLSSEIVFTSGTTEGMNLLAYGLESHINKGDEILLSVMEHHSNLVPWQQLAKRVGAIVKFVNLDAQGNLDMVDFKNKISNKTKIVSITHVSNVLGTIVDVKEITKLAHEKDAFVIIDGAQAIPHMRVNVKEIGCDFYVFSAHKMYGPTGVGVVYGKKESLEKLSPASYGGSMISSVELSESSWAEGISKFEAGTPNIAGVIAFGEALEFMAGLPWKELQDYEEQLTKRTIEGLKKLRGVIVFGPSHRAPVVSFSIEGVHPHDVAEILNKEGIAVRAGHHCAQPLMNYLDVAATTRVSFGVYNTLEEVDKFLIAMQKVISLVTESTSFDPNQIGEGDLTEEQEIYKENILDHYRHPRNFGKSLTCTLSQEEHNPLCGDRLEFFLTFDKDVVSEVTFNGKGCAVSQASASMLTEEIKGKTISELRKMDQAFIVEMLGIPLGPVRLKCALLSLKTLNKGIDKYEEK